MREREVRVHLQGIAQLFGRLVVLVGHVQPPPEAETDAERKWVKLAREVDLFDALFSAPHRYEIERIPLVSRGVTGIQLDGPLKSASGGRPIPIVVEAYAG